MRVIRKAGYDDMAEVLYVFDEARAIMRADGNPTQWGGEYPGEAIVRQDVERGVGYVIEDDGAVVGYFALIEGIEVTYTKIYEGKWSSESAPYATIHRLASTRGSKGVAASCFEWCKASHRHLRADTHRNNKIMQHVLKRAGFEYCGIIYLLSGDERLAFNYLEEISQNS